MVPQRILESKMGHAPDARRAFSDSVKEAGVIALVTVLLALGCWASGLDAWVAQRIYAPTAGWGWALRQWGAWLGGASALLALPVCLWAPLGRKWPLVQQSSLIVLLTAVLGAGLVNQVIVKDLAARPRPRDFLLSQSVPKDSRIQPMQVTAGEGLHGKSMPSGHAGMAGVLVAPWFVLRRRKPLAAKGFLATGLTATMLVGAARMALGAHFLSDVLVAGGINLAVATALAPWVQWQIADKTGRQSWWLSGILAVSLVLGVLAMVLGNRFDLTLTYPLPGGLTDVKGFVLPCWRDQQLRLATDTTLPSTEVRVELQGYGAPLSALKLAVDPQTGRLELDRRHGLYRRLKCTVTLAQPGVKADERVDDRSQHR